MQQQQFPSIPTTEKDRDRVYFILSRPLAHWLVNRYRHKKPFNELIRRQVITSTKMSRMCKFSDEIKLTID